MILQLVLRSTLWIGFMAAVLFTAAGNWGWIEGWAFIAIFTGGSIAFCAWLWRRDPELLKSRMGMVVQEGQARWDQIFMGLVVIGWNVWLGLMALDSERFHLSHVPAWLEAAGGLLIVMGFFATVPVFAANTFAAPVVRVQEERGQRVIDTGPYALVRHPMYAAAMLYLIGLPLLLGSWFGLLGMLVIAFAISWRARREEETLKRELPGYSEYMARVRWRLVPYLW